MPNLHSHAFQRVIAGLTERRSGEQDSFWSWREQMYKFQARIGPDELQTIASLAYMEMLEAGFTRVGEFHYLHHAQDGRPFDDPAEMASRIAVAASQTGIGLTLLPVFYAHSGFGGQAPNAGQARFIHDLDGFQLLLDASRKHVAVLDDAMVGIAPHSLRAVTPEELTALIPMAEGAPIHIHIAEQMREVEDCIAHTGQRPVEWLFDHAPVDAQWCLVHATHMTPVEMTSLAKSGAIAGLCPITEANLGDGLFPARDYLRQGGRFGIGSDSNVLISAAEELRLLEYGQRLIHRERNVLDNWYIRALDGAQALGVESGLAVGLAVGKAADLISLDCDLDTFIFASARSPIDCVWRYGRKQVSGGRHIKRDTILADYRRLMQRLSA
jgi:formiminoglutamate deiminase